MMHRPADRAKLTTASGSNSNDNRAHASFSTTLSLIDTVTVERIFKRNGHDQFVLSVFQHHQPKKMPLTLISPTELFFRTRQPRYLHTSSSSNEHDEPDYEIQHRYCEFLELRHHLSAIANEAHQQIAGKLSHCAFCGPLLHFLNHNRTRPSKGFKLISSSKTQMGHLASFVHRLVGMVVNGCAVAQHNHPQQEESCCDVAFQAAMMLEDFLRKPKQSPSLGII
ncbi:hypothetical protein Gpo141_00012930 [Globisporangium polare]